MTDLVTRIRTVLFANLAHYRQRCINEASDAETVAKFMAAERGEPVAWRWRYVYCDTASGWRVKQTPVEPILATDTMAALEVEPLYAGPAL